jgi:diguanylate cyclase (GGDEF)-like protein
MSAKGIREIEALRLMYGRFRSVFILVGLLSLSLTVYLALKAVTGHLSSYDIIVIAFLVLASLALCVAQVRILRALSTEAAQRIETIALFDDLTGVYNYRFMDHRLREEIARCERYGRPLSVIYIDMDHFKLVNDRHGHQTGNEVLHEIGEVLKANARTNDLVGRLGGDEFFAILPETRVEDAVAVAERFARAVRTLRYRTRDGTMIDYLRLSIGLAGYPRNATETDALLAASDRAMYRAKQSGGDTIEVASISENLAQV